MGCCIGTLTSYLGIQRISNQEPAHVERWVRLLCALPLKDPSGVVAKSRWGPQYLREWRKQLSVLTKLAVGTVSFSSPDPRVGSSVALQSQGDARRAPAASNSLQP